MALISFCGLLTLQVGVAIMAAVFFTLAGVILAANIFDYRNSIEDGYFPYSLILMVIFVACLIIAAALMFASSHTEVRSMAIAALVVIVIMICYWLILCCFSFLSYKEHVDGICIDIRCPETFWISNLHYRRYHFAEEDLPENQEKPTKKPKKPATTPASNPTGRRRRRSQPESAIDKVAIEDSVFQNIIENGHHKHSRADVFVNDKSSYHRYRRDDETSTTESPPPGGSEEPAGGSEGGGDGGTTKKPKKDDDDEDEPSRYIFGAPMIGAIFLFIVNLIFLLYSALLVYSWAQELEWAEYYYVDGPTVVEVEDY